MTVHSTERVAGRVALAVRRTVIVIVGLIVVLLLRVMLLAVSDRHETVQTLLAPKTFAGQPTASCNVFVVKSWHHYVFFDHDVRYEALIGESADYGIGLPINAYWLPGFTKVKATFAADGVTIALPPIPGAEQKGPITYHVPAAWCVGGR